MSPSRPAAFMTVDVEDWFQVENLRPAISSGSWESRELRVERNVRLILDMLAARGTRATFFVLGWIAERVPGLVREIRDGGHEIACHGHAHQLIYGLAPAAFRDDVRRAKAALEDIAGVEVVGYRAPSFSITDWAVDVLLESGFRYDSSLFPSMAHDRYGRLSGHGRAAPPIFELRPGLREVSLSCLRVAGRSLPWAGGGYFRLVPYPLFRRGVARILAGEGLYTFYIHPWELDPGQPQVHGLSWSHRFRHYNNLAKTESRYARLLRDFRFGPIGPALGAG